MLTCGWCRALVSLPRTLFSLAFFGCETHCGAKIMTQLTVNWSAFRHLGRIAVGESLDNVNLLESYLYGVAILRLAWNIRSPKLWWTRNDAGKCVFDKFQVPVERVSILTWAVTRPRFSLCKSVWLHDEFAHGAIVLRSSSNLSIVFNFPLIIACQAWNICINQHTHLNSLIWLCMNFRMFHGRSLCPSIKGTCSRNDIAASSRSSYGEPAHHTIDNVIYNFAWAPAIS